MGAFYNLVQRVMSLWCLAFGHNWDVWSDDPFDASCAICDAKHPDNEKR